MRVKAKGLAARKERYRAIARELEESGETQKSMTDADSRLMKTRSGTDVCYNVQTAVDENRARSFSIGKTIPRQARRGGRQPA